MPTFFFRSLRRTPIFIFLAFITATLFATLHGKVPLKMRRTIFPRHHVFTAAFQSEHQEPHIVDFDSNGFDVLFDNCANRTITYDKTDFVHFEPYKGDLSGVGTVPITGTGTIHWQVQTDKGDMLDIIVKDALYAPKMKHRILSITQWGKQRTESRQDDLDDLVRITTNPDDDSSTLLVNRRRTRVTISHTNDLPKARCVSPKHTSYPAFTKCFECHSSICDPNMCYVVPRSTVTREPQLQFRESAQPKDDDATPSEGVRETNSILRPSQYRKKVTFDLPPTETSNTGKSPSHTAKSDVKYQPSSTSKTTVTRTSEEQAQRNLMKVHLRCGHTPFGILKQAAKLGVLSSDILCKDNPPCPSCLYGKSVRRSWRTKATPRTIAPAATKPGDCVSVDQMVSSVPGLLAQNSGRLTRKRYKIATVFVDHASRLGYVHVHTSTDATEALEAKHAFETCARSYGIRVKRYHADNGIFNSREFLNDIEEKKQHITFCGVGAHHQSGIAEHRIRELTEMARTQLLHAMHNNPKAVNIHLWPYALRHASHIFNSFPRQSKNRSPLEIFTDGPVRPNLEHIHPFGCPVYVLRAPASKS